jgi:predicted enzyme related to lactoylglutathione lyase
MVVMADPTGAIISAWQPQIHRSAEVVNEAGSSCWNELYTLDVPTAQDFYRRLFGWEIETTELPGDGGEYTLFKVDGGTVVDGPKPTPMGPFAVIQDPVGAAFAIIQLAPES